MKNILNREMKKKNISQMELANIVGVKQQYISKIVLGKIKSPSFDLICKIADALEVDINEFREK
ncbi:helix-turn-helix domain-containing protein [Lactococcus garvieae]|uniref:helix-turn-helix domain-containing protein n=1 Tax=Lactococcus garvieae TaxID=1363 RepID=UPI0022E3D598|nr:helix-turn-helix transcriptional regulator [Lactococcus garvieae]